MAISKIKVGDTEHEIQTTISNVSGLQDALDAKATKSVASTMANGLLSSTDKSHIDSMWNVWASDGTTDTLVNKVQEVLKVFENYPEGDSIAETFAEKVDKTTTVNGHALSGNVTVTKGDLQLGNVENKSSATIRGELTKANVTTALGYTPPPTNTDTTYDLGASKSSTNGNVKLNLTAGGSGSGTDSVTIKGTGGTTVTTDANGVVTINSSATTSSSVTVDSALSSTSTNPVQNKVVNAALNNKLTANNWSTANNKLSYSLHGEEINIGVNGVYVNSDTAQTTATLTWPTKSGKLATTDDIQSYIDTAILGGSW